MFTTRLSVIPPFTNDNVSEVLSSKVHCGYYQGDLTLFVVASALIYPRLKEQEQWSAEVFEFCRDRDISYLRDYWSMKNHLSMVVVSNSFEEVSGCFDVILHEKPDWNEKEDIKKFIKLNVNSDVRVLINESLNSAMIVIFRNNIKLYHLMLSFITRCFPSYFTEKPVTESEKRLLESLCKTSHVNFLEAAKVIGEEMNLRKMILERMVKGFERRNIEALIAGANGDLESIISRANQLMIEYASCMEQRDNVNTRILGLQRKAIEQDDDSELFDYLLDHKNIEVQSVRGSVLNFIVYTDMQYFDVDQYLCMRKNGSIFDTYPGTRPEFANSEDRKLFLDAIFSESPLLKLKLCAGYKLNMNGSVSGLRVESMDGYNTNYFPNPHIERHMCLGGHGPEIINNLKRGDVILAIEQCIASAASVNVGETGPTFGPMLDNLFSISGNRKIIRNNEGVDMTPIEALAWLKEIGYEGYKEQTMTFTEDDE